MTYGQKEFVLAAQSFNQYISTYPKGRHVPLATFGLGECFMNQQNLEEAAKFYRQVIQRFPQSRPAPTAAYRLGAISYNQQEFKASSTYFNFCENKSTDQKERILAGFYYSEAQLLLGNRDKQLAALKRVIAVKTGNPVLEKALSAAATAYQSKGQNAEALPILLELSKTAKDPKLRADSTLKCAIAYTEQKKNDLAKDLYREVLENRFAETEQRGASLVGYITCLYEANEYDAVVDAYNRNASLLPPADLRPRLLLQVGNSHRLLKKYARAVETYAMIEEYYSDSDVAFEAGYWKVNCLYLLEDKQLAGATNAFLEKYDNKNDEHEYMHMARLMLAETQFAKNNFKLAASAFSGLNVDKLPAKFHEATLYHKGWSESEAGKHNDAIGSLTQYIERFPQGADMASAIAKRGLCHMQTKDLMRALQDFERIIKDYSTHSVAEMAYYFSGVIYNDKSSRNVKAMITAFEALISRYPATTAMGEASFNCGLGYMESKEFDKAIPHLRKAILSDRKNYGDQATQKLMLALWAKQDVDNLAPEVDAYRGTVADAVIPPTLLGFLGVAYTQRKEWARAAKYLTWSADFTTPSNTDSRIWKLLGESQLEIKNYAEAVAAMDHYLVAAAEDLTKAKAYHTKASALLGLGKYQECVDTAAEGLKIARSGGIQGQLLITQGDALLALGDVAENEGNRDSAKEKLKETSAKYVVPSQVLTDNILTPQALEKAARALDRLGDIDKAQQLRGELKRDYPQYQLVHP
jgi:TolA-binding protein